MISKYEIRNVLGEEILYLYLNHSYEFSNEFDQDLALYSGQFIQVNQIPFQGNKIYYVVDGMVVKKAEYKHPYYYDPEHYLVNLKLEDQSMIEMPLKDYLTSILFSYYCFFLLELMIDFLLHLNLIYLYFDFDLNEF